MIGLRTSWSLVASSLISVFLISAPKSHAENREQEKKIETCQTLKHKKINVTKRDSKKKKRKRVRSAPLPWYPGCAPNLINSANSSLLVGFPRRPNASCTSLSEYPSFNANSRYCLYAGCWNHIERESRYETTQRREKKKRRNNNFNILFEIRYWMMMMTEWKKEILTEL